MRPERGDAALLWDMLANAREVVEFTRSIDFDTYIHDTMRRRAVERTVQIIGEAASKVSRAFRDSTPEVPWVPSSSRDTFSSTSTARSTTRRSIALRPSTSRNSSNSLHR
jgi:uncharacterized protein with HEPN domain